MPVETGIHGFMVASRLFVNVVLWRLAREIKLDEKGGPIGAPFPADRTACRFPQNVGNGKTPRTRQTRVITTVTEKDHQKMKRW